MLRVWSEHVFLLRAFGLGEAGSVVVRMKFDLYMGVRIRAMEFR